MATRRKSQDAARRVRHLIALDASNIMTRLRARQDEMVTLFSRTRDRSPLLGAIHTWFHTVTFGELASLEPDEQRAINQFYESLGELRWYLQYTEDMPLQVRTGVSQAMTELEAVHRRLTQVIGPADGQGTRVVDGQVSAPAEGESPVVALRPRRSRRQGT